MLSLVVSQVNNILQSFIFSGSYNSITLKHVVDFQESLALVMKPTDNLHCMKYI